MPSPPSSPATPPQAPVRLIPFHLSGKPPSFFIVGGLVLTPVSVPYLRSEYGKVSGAKPHNEVRQGAGCTAYIFACMVHGLLFICWGGCP